MPPELEKHIHEILKHLKSQGPQDPAIFYITKATIEKIIRDKRISFVVDK